MSDLEDSRTTAVGRKRKYEHLLNNNTTGRRSSEGSKESGEISSEDDSDIEEISADQWTKKLKTSTSSSSDSDDDSSSSIEELPRKEEGDTMTRLLDISRDDQKQQTKYFNLTAMSEPVRCLSCGGKGHMAKTCSTRTCSHCQQRDLHPSSACPIWRKCGLCRERGHDAPACRNRSFRGPDPDPCDVCQKTNGHIEVSASSIETFQIFIPWLFALSE